MRITLILTLFLGCLVTGNAQPTDRSVVEIGPSVLSLKKPKKYDHHDKCEIVFENYTNVPVQIVWLRPDGKFQKLYFIDRKDTVRFETKTNFHHIVAYQGYTAGTVFVPYGDVNICKIHDRFFNETKSLKPKKFRDPVSDTYTDARFKYKLPISTYGSNKGPLIYFDEAHMNYERMECKLQHLAGTLKKDGYKVQPYKGRFTADRLAKAKILVIPNARSQHVNGFRVDSTYALIEQEADVLEEWVKNGGSLLLITDDAPLPSRIENIQKRFGIDMVNGVVKDTSNKEMGDVFSKETGALADNVITQGRNDKEAVDQVATFTGTAFTAPDKATPILTCDERFTLFFADRQDVVDTGVKSKSAEGMLQGAIMEYGAGKIAVFTDAEMFMALKHKERKEKVGVNWKYAQDNMQFILNLFHWMDGFIE